MRRATTLIVAILTFLAIVDYAAPLVRPPAPQARRAVMIGQVSMPALPIGEPKEGSVTLVDGPAGSDGFQIELTLEQGSGIQFPRYVTVLSGGSSIDFDITALQGATGPVKLRATRVGYPEDYKTTTANVTSPVWE